MVTALSNVPVGLTLSSPKFLAEGFDTPKAFCISFILTQMFLSLPFFVGFLIAANFLFGFQYQ